MDEIAANWASIAHQVIIRRGEQPPPLARRMEMLAEAWATNNPVTIVTAPRASGTVTAISRTAKAAGAEPKHVVVDPFDPTHYSQSRLGVTEGQLVPHASVLEKAVRSGQALILEVDADPSSNAARTFVDTLSTLFDADGNLPLRVTDPDGTEWAHPLKRHASARVFVVLNDDSTFSIASADFTPVVRPVAPAQPTDGAESAQTPGKFAAGYGGSTSGGATGQRSVSPALLRLTHGMPPLIAKRQQAINDAWVANPPFVSVYGPADSGKIHAIKSTASAAEVPHQRVYIGAEHIDLFGDVCSISLDPSAPSNELRRAVRDGHAIIMDVGVDPDGPHARELLEGLRKCFDAKGDLSIQAEDGRFMVIKRHENARVFVVFTTRSGSVEVGRPTLPADLT